MKEEQTATLHKEIDLIEGAIERMARNSFMIKGWTLTITAFVATMSRLSVATTALIVLIPVVGFWWLDSYYLRLERAFRKVYEDRIAARIGGDWSTNLYVINCGKFLSSIQSVKRIMFSSSTLPFYGAIVCLLMIVEISQVDWSVVSNYLPHFCHCCK